MSSSHRPIPATSDPGPAGLILAAGASHRMGRPKAALEIGDETFAARIARRMGEAGLRPRIAVAGPHEAALRAALGDQHGVEIAPNPDPASGQLGSLRVGIEHLARTGQRPSAVVVALVDHPMVALETYRRLAASADAHAIAVPTFEGRRGHPVLFGTAIWPELLSPDLQGGARTVVRRDPARVVELAVDDPGVLADIDTPADLGLLGRPGRDRR